MMNFAASKRQPSASDPDVLRHGKRAEMLNQYVQAIDQTILSFQQAYERAPQDERLITAFARFRRGLDSQLARLEALRSGLIDEHEVQTLEQTIKTVQSALSMSVMAAAKLCA